MSSGQIRRSQVVTTLGPGALIDLPKESAIMAGVDGWGADLETLTEPRVQRALARMTGRGGAGPPPELRVPPTPDPAKPWQKSPRGIDAYRFPEWFVVQERPGGSAAGAGGTGRGGDRDTTRRLVHRRELERGRFDGRPVVATRFVRACPRGHVDDLDWRRFVHRGPSACLGRLTLHESGSTGELANLRVRCSCGKSRLMTEAADIEEGALGTCTGARPWLGPNAHEACGHRARLLIRTATNAYFPLIVRALSIPEKGADVDRAVAAHWDDLGIVTAEVELNFIKRKPQIAQALAKFPDEDVMDAIARRRGGVSQQRSVKAVEIEAMLDVPAGYGDDVPVNPDFHARRLPPDRTPQRRGDLIETVVQVHRLREVLALAGFTRLQAPMPDIDGEYRDDVERAEISLDPSWHPAVENRGEGVLVQFSGDAVERWLARPAVAARVEALRQGHERWMKGRAQPFEFPGGPYVMLHTFSHLLLLSVSTRCGYPAASIRERIYVDAGTRRYGVLLYTSSPDAEGTLGGLVQEARRMDGHIETALRSASLCSNDPICAQHSPADSVEERWLHGAACHGCTLVAETACEMWNDYLDRALVVSTLDEEDAAFFPAPVWA